MKPDSARTVYDGKLIDVTLERWGDHEREIVEHPGAVAIVAIDRDGMLTLVRQRREAIGQAVLLHLVIGVAESRPLRLAVAPHLLLTLERRQKHPLPDVAGAAFGRDLIPESARIELGPDVHGRSLRRFARTERPKRP